MVPYARNDAFIGRRDGVLADEIFDIEPGNKRVALWGLGGVGYVKYPSDRF